MKKRLCSLLFCLLLLSALILPVSAKNAEVLDVASVMSVEDAAELSRRLPSFLDNYGLTVVILTVPDLMDQPIEAFADNYYDNNRYDENGVLFMVDMGSRQWHISTSGTAIELLSDRDLIQIEDEVIPYFSEGQFYEGFSCFLDMLPSCLAEESSGSSFGLPVLLGAVIAGIVLLILRSTMNTKKPQHGAACYETEGSYQLLRHQDLFLYSRVSKQAKPEPNSNSGSSTHRSSSGRSHGGRGGSF